MSLNWDIRNIKDFETVCKDEDGALKSLTHVLILSTMGVGIGALTDKSWMDFYVRLNVIQREGALLRDGDGNDVYITPADVKAHIGLHTNVRNETNAAWFKRFVTNRKSDLAWAMRREAA
jgi:hypothetical protein